MYRLTFFCLMIIGFAATVQGQTYAELRDSAAVKRNEKDYRKAFSLLSLGIKVSGHPYHNDLYDAAALASLIRSADSAFYYLDQLLNAKEYDMILSDARGDADFKNLQGDQRWWPFIGKAGKSKTNENIRMLSAVASTVSRQERLKAYSDSALNSRLYGMKSAESIYPLLTGYSTYPVITRKQNDELLAFATEINDSTTSFYEVQLPHHYDEKTAYPVLLVLHGAVSSNMAFGDPRSNLEYGSYDTTGMNQFFSRYGYSTNTIVVYPHANADFNWMSGDDGFPMILNIVSDLKRYFNVNDDRVFISGHSNGATGVVSYLLKSPSLFAGFYGFNSNPRIRTGGTFLKNATNRSYFNVATDKDYYFPVSGHDTLAQKAKALGIDWQNHVYKGFPHWFPQFPEAEPAFALMFADMKSRTRNPFRQTIYWQCDDIRNGRCDWLSIDKMDTATLKQANEEINFPVSHWISNEDTSKILDTVITAFNFPRRSATIHANYKHNRFDVITSGTAEFTFYLSPEMIDFSKPVSIFCNGKKLFDKQVNYNKDYMLRSFRENFDRKAVWVNAIKIKI